MAWITVNEFKLVFYRIYVDDIFVLVKHLSKFHAYLNTCHPNISFSFEQEVSCKLSFLDVHVSPQQDKFIIAVSRKPTVSGVYTYFDSFLQMVYKVDRHYSLPIL